MKPIVNYGLSDSLIDAVRKSVEEGKGDGNLANNAKPYNKITRGDVIAGRLGNDEKGGKKGGKTTINTKPKLKEEEEQMDEASAQDIVARLKKKHKDGNFGVGPGGEVTHPYLEKDSVNRRIAALKKEYEQMDEANSDNPEYEAQLAAIDMYHYKKADHHRRTLQTLGTQGNLNTPEGNFHKVALEKHRAALNAMAASDHESMRKKLKQLMRSNLKREEYEQMDEVKLADLPRRFVPGTGQYDGSNYVDPQGADETAADMKKADPKGPRTDKGLTRKRRFNTKSYDKINGRLKALY